MASRKGQRNPRGTARKPRTGSRKGRASTPGGGGGGTLVYSDDFNRADSSAIGANWTEAVGDGTVSIVSNRLAVAGGSQQIRQTFWNQALPSANQWVEWDVVNTTDGDPSFYLRGNSPSSPTTFYEFSVQNTAGGNVYIRKCVSNAYTAIGNSTTAAIGANLIGKTFRIEAEGTTLRAKVNGVTAFTMTDAAIASGGYVGIRTDFTGESLDNFRAGTLP